jgi:hypothetical protein
LYVNAISTTDYRLKRCMIEKSIALITGRRALDGPVSACQFVEILRPGTPLVPRGSL